MTRVLFGNENVGVQGIYYFSNPTDAELFAPCVKKVMDSIRNGNNEWELILEQWQDSPMLYNYLLEVKNKTEQEEKDVTVWYERGGEYWGSGWDGLNFRNVQYDEMYNGEAWIKNDIPQSKDDIPDVNALIMNSIKRITDIYTDAIREVNSRRAIPENLNEILENALKEAQENGKL